MFWLVKISRVWIVGGKYHSVVVCLNWRGSILLQGRVEIRWKQGKMRKGSEWWKVCQKICLLFWKAGYGFISASLFSCSITPGVKWLMKNLHGLFELFENSNCAESWISHLCSHICQTCARTHKPNQFPSWLYEVHACTHTCTHMCTGAHIHTYLLSEICCSATGWCYEVLH